MAPTPISDSCFFVGPMYALASLPVLAGAVVGGVVGLVCGSMIGSALFSQLKPETIQSDIHNPDLEITERRPLWVTFAIYGLVLTGLFSMLISTWMLSN